MIKALLLSFHLLVLFNGGVVAASHVFYPFPPQDYGIVVTAAKTIDYTKDSLLMGQHLYPDQKVTAVYKDSNHQLWFGTSNGLYLSYRLVTLLAILFLVMLSLFIAWRARVSNDKNLRLKQSIFRKTAKIELQKMQLYASNTHMQRILHIRQNYMAQLSHELRTPLMLILGPVQKMLATSQGESTELLQIVTKNVDRSLHLAEQLLIRDALTFVDPGKPCEQLVSPIIQACCMSWQIEADQKEVVLCFEDEASGGSVKMAPHHLEIMLGNLLSNALKYTPSQGCISVSFKCINHQLVVSVSDTGKGMSIDVRKNIFDSYFKEDADFTLEAGFGLGLSTVKQLVDLYAGDISVISYQGVGSEFILTLPLYREGGTKTAVDEESIERQDDIPQLLVASTDDELVSCLTALLADYRLTVAYDGYEAMILAKEIKPDIVLCDLDLPGLDGWQVRERLQEVPVECQSAIVLMADANNCQDCVDIAVDSLLTKPLDPDSTLSHIQFLLNREKPPFSEHAIDCGKVSQPAAGNTPWRKRDMTS